MKNLITLLSVVVIASCATTSSTQRINLTEATLIDFPQQGVIVTASLGDRLVAKGYKEEGPAYELYEGELIPIGGSLIGTCAATNVFPQSWFIQRKKSNGDMCAGPFNISLTQAGGATDWKCTGRTGNSIDICYSNSNNNFYVNSSTYLPITNQVINSNLIKKIKKIKIQNNNFLQEFIYNGKVNNELRFIYREFSSDMIRPAFNQSVQYDYDDSKLISFKGLNIEIIEANNQIIKYKLIRNF
jgi:hypothetical protein